jgi:hypothetical protein
MYVIIMHSIITKTRDCFFSADDGGISGGGADDKSKAISSFGKDHVFPKHVVQK